MTRKKNELIKDESREEVIHYEPLELHQLPQAKLCKHCKEAIDAWPLDCPPRRPYPSSPWKEGQLLLKVESGGVNHMLGAEEGCALCLEVLRWPKWARTKTHELPESVTEYYLHNQYLTIRHSSGLRWVMSRCSVEEIQRLKMIPPLAPLTWNPRSAMLAKQWIKGCRTNHKLCNSQPLSKGLPNSFRPTRLVDVGDSSAMAPKICLGADLPDDTQYFTLSHCWGKSPMFKLVSHNLQELMEKIDVQKVSKTFRQAFDAVRDMNGRYVWVDSLCIIQDSKDDWRKESAMMAEIYSNSYCNIAASAAQDGNGGLFFERDIFPIKQLRIRLEPHPEILTYFRWKVELDEKPLAKRGWVFQEQVLSPQSLYFLEDELYWGCREALYSEVFPEGQLNKSTTYGLETSPYHKSFIPPPLERDRFGAWRSLVTVYANLSLTFQADKLIALSGIARVMHASIRQRYLAGNWEGQFPGCLYWSPLGEETSQSEEYVAPTWSWASRKGPVGLDFDQFGELQKIEIVHFEPSLAGEDPFGQLSGGYITLKWPIAPMQRLIVHATTNSVGPENVYYKIDKEDEDSFKWDATDFETTISQLESLYIMGSRVTPHSISARAGLSHADGQQDTYMCLVLGKSSDGRLRRYGRLTVRNEKVAEYEAATRCFREYADHHDVLPLLPAENGNFLITIY